MDSVTISISAADVDVDDAKAIFEDTVRALRKVASGAVVASLYDTAEQETVETENDVADDDTSDATGDDQ